MEIVRIHIKLYIFGELSIWNCRIRCLKCVLEFYKKVKKKYVKILSSENGVFFKQKYQHFQFFNMFPVSYFHKNLRESRQMSNRLKSAVFFEKSFLFKRYCDFRRFSLDGTFCRGITTKPTLTLEIKRLKQVSIADSESADQGGDFTLLFDQIRLVNQKLEKVSVILNFHVRDIYI